MIDGTILRAALKVVAHALNRSRPNRTAG